MACLAHIFNGYALNILSLMNVPTFVCGIITRIRPPSGILPTLFAFLRKLELIYFFKNKKPFMRSFLYMYNIISINNIFLIYQY